MGDDDPEADPLPYENWSFVSVTITAGPEATNNDGSVDLTLSLVPDELTDDLGDEVTYGGFVQLLKMDLDIHEPNVPFVGLSRPAPIEIPENEQQNPNRCEILINNDNDDLDSLFNGSAIAVPYPQDNDDELLKLRDPIGFGHPTDDDDVVLVTLRQFNGVNTGKIKLTTSSNADVRFFKYEEGEYELDAVSFSDLEVDLSSPGTESPLKDLPNEDVSFYVEGINANDDLTVSMIFEDANENELARQEVHLKIRDVEQTIGLVAIAHDSLAESAVKSYLTEHIQGANAVRYDRDGLDENADTIVPVLFKLEALLPADSTHPDWDDVTYGTSGSANELTSVLNFISQVTVGAHIYVTGDIERHDNTVFPNGVTQLGSEKGMCVALHKPTSRVISHEWLHAYGNVAHQCVDYHLMEGDISGQPPCNAIAGNDTRQNESDLIMDYDW